jgi:hypothetical protein
VAVVGSLQKRPVVLNVPDILTPAKAPVSWERKVFHAAHWAGEAGTPTVKVSVQITGGWAAVGNTKKNNNSVQRNVIFFMVVLVKRIYRDGEKTPVHH